MWPGRDQSVGRQVQTSYWPVLTGVFGSASVSASELTYVI